LKILLTGADGFTGVHFTRAALGAGHQVVPLVADLTDKDALHSEVAAVQPQAVAHLAGIAFVGHAHDADFYAVNTVGTATLLEALSALSTCPNKVLVASSANVYGNSKHSPITENAPLAPANHYAVSKMAMEAIARTYADRLPLVIARPFNYTGVGQSMSFLIPKLVSNFVRKSDVIELGNLDVQREFNNVAMVCAVYLGLLECGVPGDAYNVCTGKMYSLHDVLSILTGLTGHRPAIKVNPAFVRLNEVQQLSGCPAKLNQLIQAYLAACNVPMGLEDMLSEMLAHVDPNSGLWRPTASDVAHLA
jgi:nucleoside-diphosphate-sugar epimerase